MLQSGIRLIKGRTRHYDDFVLLCQRGEKILAEIRCHVFNRPSFDVVHLAPLDGAPDPADLRQVRAVVRAVAQPSDHREDELYRQVVTMMRHDADDRPDLTPGDFLNPEHVVDETDLSGLPFVTERVADQEDLIRVLARAFERIRTRDGVTITVNEDRSGVEFGKVRIRLVVHGKENRFSFWKSADIEPTKDGELYVVPPYHPAIAQKKNGAWMVNGDTNALIRGDVVRSLLPPSGTTAGPNGLFGHSEAGWAQVAHPWKAEGTDFGLVLDPFLCRTAHAVDTVTDLIHCALGRDKKHYAEINGGFRSPLTHPANVLNALRAPIPAGCREVRGSENHCVWTRRVLAEEGQLAGARIPDWFEKEGWLALYAHYERRKNVPSLGA